MSIHRLMFFYLFCLWQHDLCGITRVENHRKLLKKPPKLPAPGWFGLGDGARHKLRGAPQMADADFLMSLSHWWILVMCFFWRVLLKASWQSISCMKYQQNDGWLSTATWVRQVQAHPVRSSFSGTKGIWIIRVLRHQFGQDDWSHPGKSMKNQGLNAGSKSNIAMYAAWKPRL